jgi:hypothetical protein
MTDAPLSAMNFTNVPVVSACNQPEGLLGAVSKRITWVKRVTASNDWQEVKSPQRLPYLNLVHELHGLNDADGLPLCDMVSLLHKRWLARSR